MLSRRRCPMAVRLTLCALSSLSDGEPARAFNRCEVDLDWLYLLSEGIFFVLRIFLSELEF